MDLRLLLRILLAYLVVSLIPITFGLFTINAQIEYDEAAEIREAQMGVERVARFTIPAYASKAISNDDVRWVQIDLGSTKKVEAIKLLPSMQIWGPAYGGFPEKFKIEISNDADFKTSIMYEDFTTKFILMDKEYPLPVDQVSIFDSKKVYGRYVRLTATKLRDSKLAFTKIMVMSGGKDIAEGCKATESNPSKESHIELLTRVTRPQGEFDVTDNPMNVMSEKTWTPVANKAEKPLGGVKLGDGLFKTVMNNNINYLLNSFTFDQLVRNFRVKAGLPVKPFDEYLGRWWFQMLPGSEAGRFLMGAGNTLRWIENEALRKEMNDIIDVIDQCKESDGYCMAYPKHTIFDVEYGAYSRSWVTHGLIEAGYAGNEKAFKLLRGFYDWFDQSAFLPEMLRRPLQGTQGIIPNARTYFTPVGKPKDIQVIQRYFQENYWMEGLASHNPDVIWQYPYDHPHNYLVTAIEPYLDMYRATGAQKYLDAAKGGWDLFHDNWEHVGGSLAINEGYIYYPPKSYYLHKETGEFCGNVFWVFLNQRFHLLYPEEEKYVTEIEKSIYNIAISNQYRSEGIRYFAKMVDKKMEANCSNSCCEGQGTRLYGALPEFIYSVAKDGIYIDLFVSSEINCTINKKMMKLKMMTQFPYSSKVKITVENEQSMQGKINIRIPSWVSAEMSISVNGSKYGKGKPGTYLSIEREWQNNDVISFILPMDFRVTKYTGMEEEYKDGHYALEYGPFLMAMVSVEGKKVDIIGVHATSENISSMLKPVEGKPLHFTIEGNPAFEYWPYFEVQDQPFSCFPKFY